MQKTDNQFLCGKRIKITRLISGLSRRQLAEKYSFSADTLQSWELGRNPLSEKGANKLIEIFKNENVYCSIEWLLYGIGSPPRPLHEIQPSFGANESIIWSDEISIQKEVDAFLSVNNNATVLLVNDDGMEPLYSIGDYVGGKKRYNKEINEVNGLNCIVQIENDYTFIRQVKKNTTGDFYNLFCINSGSMVQSPVISGVKILSAAPIIWHKKDNKQ